ncbi:MAG: hypothetical protein IT159_08405 [Bryobacterales bacterium]|nr:hypothetical protein [Bryobacterales bacterium]
MAEVYRTGARAGGNADTIVIHCSDSRFQRHFQEFLEKHLGLDNYGLLAVPGGPQFLTLVDYLPKFSWVGWRWVQFLVDAAPPRRIILIAHHDCLWYRDSRFSLHRGDVFERQVGDLQRVRKAISGRFPGLAAELYYARLEQGEASFEPV